MHKMLYEMVVLDFRFLRFARYCMYFSCLSSWLCAIGYSRVNLPSSYAQKPRICCFSLIRASCMHVAVYICKYSVHPIA